MLEQQDLDAPRDGPPKLGEARLAVEQPGKRDVGRLRATRQRERLGVGEADLEGPAIVGVEQLERGRGIALGARPRTGSQGPLGRRELELEELGATWSLDLSRLREAACDVLGEFEHAGELLAMRTELVGRSEMGMGAGAGPPRAELAARAELAERERELPVDRRAPLGRERLDQPLPDALVHEAMLVAESHEESGTLEPMHAGDQLELAGVLGRREQTEARVIEATPEAGQRVEQRAGVGLERLDDPAHARLRVGFGSHGGRRRDVLERLEVPAPARRRHAQDAALAELLDQTAQLERVAAAAGMHVLGEPVQVPARPPEHVGEQRLDVGDVQWLELEDLAVAALDQLPLECRKAR